MADKKMVYVQGNMRIEVIHSGEFTLPKNNRGRWFIIDEDEPEATSALEHTAEDAKESYPQNQSSEVDNRFLVRLRELAPHPDPSEIMYSEEDIDALFRRSPEDINDVYTAFNPISTDSDTDENISDEPSYTVPEQIRVTNEEHTGSPVSKAVILAKKLLGFIPDDISTRLRVFNSVDDIFKEGDTYLINRVVRMIPNEAMVMFSKDPVIIYLGFQSDNDCFTFEITIKGLCALLQCKSIRADIAKNMKSNWSEIETIFNDLEEGLEQFEAWATDTFADARMYDSDMNLFDLMKLYDDIGLHYVQHNNGRKIFDNFIESNEFERMDVNIDGDIFTGYYANHVLFVKDCTPNYIRIYVFDVLLNKEDIFNGSYNDPGYMSLFINDVEYCDDILDVIRDHMFDMYERAFIEYNAPCRPKKNKFGETEDTDV